MNDRKTTKDFDQELIHLFDQYVHGGIDRRGFLDRAAKYAVGGVTAAMLLDQLSPQFAAAQQVKPDDTRLKTERVSYPSPNGNAKNAGFQLVRNSMAISSMALTLNEETPAIDKTDHSLRIDVRENVLCRGISFGQNQNKPADTGAEAGALLKRLVAWHEQRNAYSSNATLLLLAKRDQLIDITWDRTKLAEWNAFWGIDNTGSVQGTLAFQGGDLQKKAQESPAALVPADFRLTKASIGKGKRSDGKDLGADLDLVGPGPAYEKWKQTKGYEQWLRDTGSKR